MIVVEDFVNALKNNGIDFITGVPDSLLKNVCAYITSTYPVENHIIASNEGGAIALASGYYIATGSLPLVYMQNSGLGNAINPLLSLADKEVYSIPLVLLIGWRGEPGIKDEPQHIKQGRVQNAMLDAMEIPYFILEPQCDSIDLFVQKVCKAAIEFNNPVAIVVRKDTFTPYKIFNSLVPDYEMSRENALGVILNEINPHSIVVSTTGKTSREVFECRERNQTNHDHDFLTVGSMGHSSQIALGISLKTDNSVFCIDGDGALIMHLGSLAICGKYAKSNFFHIVLNNGSHESVGGQPTVGFDIDFTSIAKNCGYNSCFRVDSSSQLVSVMHQLPSIDGPVFIEVRVKAGSRSDLGRPKSRPIENKAAIMLSLMNK